ncbi:RICIN domain-containing protein [Streptosporangium sp. NPDC023615]
MDVSGFGTANGTKVHIWTCAGGTNQRWTRV